MDVMSYCCYEVPKSSTQSNLRYFKQVYMRQNLKETLLSNVQQENTNLKVKPSSVPSSECILTSLEKVTFQSRRPGDLGT